LSALTPAATSVKNAFEDCHNGLRCGPSPEKPADGVEAPQHSRLSALTPAATSVKNAFEDNCHNGPCGELFEEGFGALVKQE